VTVFSGSAGQGDGPTRSGDRGSGTAGAGGFGLRGVGMKIALTCRAGGRSLWAGSGAGRIISSSPIPPRAPEARCRFSMHGLSQLHSGDNAARPGGRALAGLETNRARWKGVPNGDLGVLGQMVGGLRG